MKKTGFSKACLSELRGGHKLLVLSPASTEFLLERSKWAIRTINGVCYFSCDKVTGPVNIY